jgi:hypothetical protein
MLQTFRLLIAAGWLAALCAACTPKPAPAPEAPPAYKENPY